MRAYIRALSEVSQEHERRLKALEDKLNWASKGGKIGGAAKTQAKLDAARANGKKGGRPLKTP